MNEKKLLELLTVGRMMKPRTLWWRKGPNLGRNCHQRARARTVLLSKEEAQYVRDCETLQVSANCDENEVRTAFIHLAKKYHPDGRGGEASADKFNELDVAYRNMLKRFADQRHNLHKIEGEYGLYYDSKKNNQKVEEKEEEAEEDIKHTAPQHRQYLSYDGFGFGSPATREKQYQKFRAAKAASNVHEHRIKQAIKDIKTEEKALTKDKRAAKKIMTSFGMDRLVEDMIQESMARGEFDNLSGQGKPLKHDSSYNPYIDFTTHKLNQVLIDNGFVPEWILLEKEIRQEIREIREILNKKRHHYEETLTPTQVEAWNRFLEELKPTCDQLNAKIQKYNLVVPSIHKQIFCVELDRVAKKVLSEFSSDMRNSYLESVTTKAKREEIPSSDHLGEGQSILGIVLSVFSNK